jgi:hypothetical protein
MNMKTLKAPIEISVVNFSSLDDGIYEAESIRQKRVCSRNMTLQTLFWQIDLAS